MFLESMQLSSFTQANPLSWASPHSAAEGQSVPTCLVQPSSFAFHAHFLFRANHMTEGHAQSWTSPLDLQSILFLPADIYWLETATWHVVFLFSALLWLLQLQSNLLNLGTINIFSLIILCCGWLSCAPRNVQQRPWLDPLNARSILPSGCDNQNCPLGTKITPTWEPLV